MDKSLVFLIICCVFASARSQQLTCDVARGWEYGGRDECYKVYYGNDVRSWHRAREICNSYGARLVNIHDQKENDLIGALVARRVGAASHYWIGLSNNYDGCTTCPDLTWHGGPQITNNQGMWADRQPDDDEGDCVFAGSNPQDYCYDRPYVWSFDKCVRQRPFVCEKMAIPEGTFPCFTEGHARTIDQCDGVSNCADGSDELNCPGRFRYFHSGPSGTLTRVDYLPSRTVTWAIQTPEGTNAIVRFQNFQTESDADIVIVLQGSLLDSRAQQVAILSGNQGNPEFRSYNNMMLVKFTTDADETAAGFVATWDSVSSSVADQSLIATPTVKNFPSSGVFPGSFLGWWDYVIVIHTEDQTDQLITLEVTSLTLHDSDVLTFYNGDSPYGEILATMCNQGCDNTKLVYSTGTAMYIILQTGRDISGNVNLAFNYRQGCYYETTDEWGELFSPGFPAGLDYPNSMTCQWVIRSSGPVSFLFDSDTVLADEDYGRVNNGDFLKIYDDGADLHTDPRGFGTIALRGQTIQATTGRVVLEFITSPNRAALGFRATWSIGCPDPQYDANTIVNTVTPVSYYTAEMTLSCARGFDFLQTHIPANTNQVQMRCGYRGVWLQLPLGTEYRQVPRCSPKYCDAPPNIANGYIDYITGPVYQDVAVYRCFPGSVIRSGTGNSTCENNGAWTQPPTCEAAECNSFNLIQLNIQNGFGVLVTGSGNGREIGSIIEYECNSGYSLIGSPITSCADGGQGTAQYTHAAPSCIALTCYLPNVPNQQPWGDRTISFNQQVNLLCMTGYEVSNSALNPIRCQANRTITEMPMCVDIDECGPINPCSDGCDNTDGSFTCTCPSGYRLQANLRDCEDINECLVQSLHNCAGQCRNLPGSYECSCNAPFTLYDQDGVSGYQIPFSENGRLPSDTYYLNHSCVYLECPTPDASIANADLMYRQDHYRVGDKIAYQCRIGFRPRMSVLQCGNNGQWTGTVPDCIPATCPPDVVNNFGFVNPAAYNTGSHQYTDTLYLNCTIAGNTFSKYRHCTYDAAQDTYLMQGSGYDCGDIDCGEPESVGGSFYSNRNGNYFGDSFTFTCQDNSLSGSSEQGDSIVHCQADGNWDFGSLTCLGRSCVNPGFPAGGNIVATSLADQQQVTFTCDRSGYSLTDNTPLVCNGDTFNRAVPQCVDTDDPVFTNCDRELTLVRYESIAGRLPQNTFPSFPDVRDNTGIWKLEVSPADANTSRYLTQEETITYTATDFAGNFAVCTVTLRMADETPPTVTCPDIEIISHSLLSSTSDFVVTENSITRTDNQPGTPVVSINNENFPTTFTSAHLYQTLTYTVQVFDQSNNVATCKSQIFVRPTSCSEASFRVPLNSAVTFNQVNFGLLRATVTCDTQYTFLTGKTITVECQGGTWQNYEPACVRDVTKPRLVCPSSQIIYYDNTAQTIDFTNLAVGTSDNNNMGPLQFQPETKTFTAADLYETTQVRVQVTDDAGNQGIGYFQYTLLPEPCSPAALPVTLDAQATTCNPTFGGYTCTIQCNDGYVLRGRGQSETISCTTGNAWGQIFTACIRDTLPPTLTCPESRVMYLSDANDFGSIDFTDINSGFQNYVTSDNSGAVPTVEFLPSVFDYGLSTLYQEPRAFVVRASDASGNRAQCTFEVAIVADVCSPLSLDSPVGGPPPQCDSTVNGWSCNITCNPGYEFYGTQASYIVTSCTTGNRFDTYVPGCVRSSLTVPKVFIGKLKYTYQPSDGTRNITDVSCINHYRQVQLERQNQMAGRLLTSCLQTYPYDIEVQFINSTFKVNKYRDTNGFERIVEILSNYRLINRGIHNSSKVHENCVSTYDTHIPNPNALFTFQASLPGDGNFCPEIVFSEAEHLPTSGAECFSPYYEDPNDVQACLLCPDGTESDSVFCSVCGLGEYSTEFGCMSCGTGYTTRYPGQRSSAACVRACDPGSISSTGYEPCFNCPRGSYSSDTRTCTPCQPGYTTSFFGSATSDSCQLESIVNVIEPCPIGTTSDGSGGCDLCPQGTYGTTFNSLCQTCQPIGASFTYVEGGTSSNVCKAYCGQGFISGTGMPPCQECPLGTRWINSTYCQACPPGFTTDGTGFIGCTVEAQIRVRCPPGMYRDAQEDCRKCPVGTYNSFEESSCSFCGTGKSTYSDGSTSVNMCFDMCAPGFSSASGLSPCTKCGVGRYWVNSTLCSDCPGAATTMTDTAVSSNECYDPCPAGQFSYNGYDVNGACRPCPFNHYQISPQATSCVRCAGNQYTLSQGSTSPNDCVSSAALCTSTTCANGGTCQFNTLNTYTCECAPGYYGRNCESTTNYCLSQPCYNNGQCQRTLNGYTCSCPTGTGGDRCETITPSCDRSTNNPTCDNGGYCIDYPNSFNCLCRDGFSGNTCSQNVSVCVSDPCNAAGTVFGGCREASNGKNLRRICQCRPGWTGRSCEINIDECASTPCINGGTCQNLENDFRCDCPGGYGGRYCHQRSDRCIAQTCNSPNSICVDDHRVDEPRCICETGYSHGVYTDYQLLINTVTADLDQFLQSNIIEDSSIDDCRATCDQRAACSFFVYATNERKCYLGGNQQLPTTSSSNHNLYLKQLSNPDTDFWTQSYDVDTPSSSNGYDDVESVTKLNNQYGLNICGGTEPLEARCCTGGSCSTNNFPVGMRCDIQGAVCEVGSSFNPCPDFSVQFKCAAHRVFKSNLCSIKNDYCSSSPCVRGSCRENPGDGYSCFCPAGYTGLNCQTDIDECANNPCMNDGVCTDLVADYECACDGFEGKNCQTPINYCFLNSVNCNNRGQCVNNRHGYECRCISGYTGQDCETMIDYCASSPCIHGSTCQPLLNDYNCGCEQGFFGKNCQFTVDNCAATSCFGSCYNLFNNYYCQCPPNVFGSNCENRPDPCGDYNICLNGGFCTDDDVTMSCACSAQYEGNGCEVRRDLCGVDNACQNGAECQLLASSPWYRCVCPSGYTGDNCDIDVNECSPNPCTPGAQCYDDINRYHCVCPIGRTGNNCARDFDPNYDLFIHHPQGLAYARTPYSVAVDTMNAMTISLWVRFAEADGEGVYMTTYIGGQFETATKFLEFTESGVRVYVPNGIVDLQYNRLVKINDGNWHLVHFAWDSVNGRVQIYADTIANVAQTNGWLINPDYSFRMWVVLGCEMEQSPMRCSGDNSFYGFLSQVTFYKRMLTFAGTATVPGEIPYIYANPRALIAPQEDWLLVWHGYLTESGVDRITPSEAKGDRCSKVGRNPPCRFYQATTLPYTNNCPSDITINSPDRVTEVTWTEPVFVNLRGGSVEKNYLPRSSLGWGEYHVQYVAESSDGYKAYCTFNIYIQNNPCPAFPNPFSGTQTSVSNNPVGWTAAVPSCIDGNQQTYSIDRYHPEVFTCGPSGHWNRALPNQRCRYPSCGPVQDQPKVTLKLRMIYKISTPACNATAVNIQVRVREEFVALQSIFTGTLCSNPACQDIETTVFCPENTDNNNFLRDTLVNIIVREADSTTNLDQNILKTEEFLRYFALAQDIFDFSETIPNGNILDNSFYITTTRVCPVGQVIIDGSCVTCGAGNFFRYVADEETTENAICDDCPLGFYEDRPGQSSCKQCPPGQTTEMTGTFDRFSCKNICPTGQYFDYGADGCLDCDIGYYQENEGQFRCDFCGAGFTTQNMGSDSADLCKATCVSGYELSGETCTPCQRGTYRNAALTRTCVQCPTGTITQDVASTSRDDCNIPACLEGTRYNMATNSCVNCLRGEYQDQKYQTECISCGDSSSYSTPAPGSTDQSACYYFCPSGFEVRSEGICDICEIGSYKDNDLGDLSTCTSCPPNYRTPGQGATNAAECTIYKCPVGYQPNLDNTDCTACPLGYYQDVANSVDCKQCSNSPIPLSTRDIASNSSDDCEAYCDSGYEKRADGFCQPCPRGTYKNNIQQGLFGTCMPCNAIFTTPSEASTSSDACTIRTCPPGTRRTADDTDCVGCPLDTYQPDSFQTSCLPCGNNRGTRQENSTSFQQCEDYCVSGYEKLATGCSPCPIGEYKNNDEGKFGMCSLCPIDKITANTASATVDLCTIGNCTAGSYRTGDDTCALCAKGTYQSQWWQFSCELCGTDKTTEQPGADDISLCILVCQPGFEDAGGFCTPCPRGFWKTEEAATTCKPCPTGTTTENAGTVNQAQCTLPACQMGYYLDRQTNPANPTCKVCPYDTYQDEIWMESCKPCPNGRVTLFNTATSSIDCVANCSSGAEYNSVLGTCDLCPRGYYRDQSDRNHVRCQMCPLDRITVNTGATDRSQCTAANCTTPGQYRDTSSNPEVCRACPLDEWQSQKWQTGCVSCPNNFGTQSTGSSSSDDCLRLCAPGTYLSTTGGGCLNCPRGTFKADRREAQCTPCPNGLLTANDRQTSDATCVISPCAAGEQYNQVTRLCNKCPIGFYQSATGQFDCNECPYDIKYTPNSGATSVDQCRSPCQAGEEFNVVRRVCDPCRRGYFQPQDNQFTCVQCPQDRQYTTQTGATSLNQCYSPCDNNLINDCSDNATCTVDVNDANGYTCDCFSSYDDVGTPAGRSCVHKCDRGYCNNGGACTRSPTPVCACSEWYQGDRCQQRIRGDDLADDTLMDIVIPVVIGVGGLVLFLILLTVCLLCYHKRKISKPPTRHTEYNGHDKQSLHSVDYGQQPYNGRGSVMMLAPAGETYYTNSVFKGDLESSSTYDNAVYTA